MGVIRFVRFTSAGQIAGSPFILKINKNWHIKTTSEQEWNRLIWKEAEHKRSTDKEKARTYPTQRSFLLWSNILSQMNAGVFLYSQSWASWCHNDALLSQAHLLPLKPLSWSLISARLWVPYIPTQNFVLEFRRCDVLFSLEFLFMLQSVQNVLLLIITKGFPYECTFGYNRSLLAGLNESGSEWSRAQDKTEDANLFE